MWTGEEMGVVRWAGELRANNLKVEGWVNISGMNISNDGTKTTFLGTAGDYNRIGDAGVTSESLVSEDDLLVTGKLEVDGLTYFDGITNFQSTNSTIEWTTDHMSINKGGDAGVYLFEGATGAETPIFRVYGINSKYFQVKMETDGSTRLDSNGEISFDAPLIMQSAAANGIYLGYYSADNLFINFGQGLDAEIKYDGTNLIINPKLVGTGILDVLGNLKTEGYQSADGSAGISTTITTGTLVGKTITIKNGLITGFA